MCAHLSLQPLSYGNSSPFKAVAIIRQSIPHSNPHNVPLNAVNHAIQNWFQGGFHMCLFQIDDSVTWDLLGTDGNSPGPVSDMVQPVHMSNLADAVQ
eukprot:scaffold47725_cov18-Prasinocladus_malaysianus.AAC.1